MMWGAADRSEAASSQTRRGFAKQRQRAVVACPLSTPLCDQIALYLVIVDHDLLGHWPRLAGEDKSSVELPRLQRIVHLHMRIAFDELGAAGASHSAPA